MSQNTSTVNSAAKPAPFEISTTISDLSGVAAVASVAGKAGSRLSNVWLEGSGEELRAVASDSRILAVARVFTKKADDKPGGPTLRVVEKTKPPQSRPAGRDGVTTSLVKTGVGVGVAGRELRDQLTGFCKAHRSFEEVNLRLSSEGLRCQTANSSVLVRSVSMSYFPYAELFTKVEAGAKEGGSARLVVNAEQMMALARSTGATTSKARRELVMAVEGYTSPETGVLNPLRVDLLGEDAVLGTSRRWVGLVAPTVIPEN